MLDRDVVLGGLQCRDRIQLGEEAPPLLIEHRPQAQLERLLVFFGEDADVDRAGALGCRGHGHRCVAESVINVRHALRHLIFGMDRRDRRRTRLLKFV